MSARTFEELKPGINQALCHLKNCKDFTTKKVNESLEVLENAGYPTGCSNRCEVAMHLIGEGFGQLSVKIWCSLRVFLEREKWRQRGYRNLARMMSFCHNYTDVCPELDTELGKYGYIPLMLAGLEKLKLYFNQESDFKIIQHVVSNIFGILHNLIRLCSGNREMFRKAGAVNSLKEYLKHPAVSTKALMILAYIVNESESRILAESVVGVATLVQLLQLAIQSSNHIVEIFHKTDPQIHFRVCDDTYFSAFELSDCLNHLVITDANKRAIVEQGGIPTIIRMLQDDFTKEEQTVAAELLWNLAFIDSIRQSEQLQDALQGN